MTDLSPSERAIESLTAKRAVLAELRALRRRRDRAEVRAAEAAERFEAVVAQLASTRPAAADWFEHPGSVVTRAELLKHAELAGTVPLHRIMERHRKRVARERQKARDGGADALRSGGGRANLEAEIDDGAASTRGGNVYVVTHRPAAAHRGTVNRLAARRAKRDA